MFLPHFLWLALTTKILDVKLVLFYETGGAKSSYEYSHAGLTFPSHRRLFLGVAELVNTEG